MRAIRRLLVLLAMVATLAVPVAGGPVASAAPRAAGFAQLGGGPPVFIGTYGGPSPQSTISDDGSTVVFESDDPLTPSAVRGQHLFAYDVATGTIEQLDVAPNGLSDQAMVIDGGRAFPSGVSRDGRFVAFRHASSNLDASRPTEFETLNNLYLRDRQTNTTSRLNIRDDGTDFNDVRSQAVSDDGRVVAYLTTAPNVIDSAVPLECSSGGFRVFVVETQTLDNTQITLPADGGCGSDLEPFGNVDLSGDGRYVVFASRGTALVSEAIPPNTLQVYRHDRQTGTTVLVSRAPGNRGGNSDSMNPKISADGRTVAYESTATDLVPGDANARSDIFVTDVATGTTTLVSRGEDGQPGPDDSILPSLSSNGRFVSFFNRARLAGPPIPDREGSSAGIYRVDLADDSLVRADVPTDGSAPSEAASDRSGVADNGALALGTRARNFPEGSGVYYVPGVAGPVDPPPPPPSPPPAPPGNGTDALIDFAVEVSQVRFGPEGTAGEPARWAVVSRDDAFADSLSGSVLAGGGPLLFTPTGSLDPRTAAEIDRVLGGSGTVYLLGGVGAIAEGVAQALASAGYTVSRLAGDSRFETSVRIAQEARTALGDTGVIALARAFGPDGNPTAAWADSVTGGGWAAGTGTPIALTTSDELHPAVAAFVGADAPTSTVLLGGEGALSSALQAGAPGAVRIAGSNRAATAVEIATRLFQYPTSGTRTYAIINAEDEQGWAYGLAGAGLSGDIGVPILATGNIVNPPETLAAVASCTDEPVTLLRFGPVSTTLMTELRAQDDGPC